MTYLFDHIARVGWLALAHITLVGAALACAALVAIPLGVYAAREPRKSGWILGGLGALYTIPSLALLAVLVRALGLGYAPAFVALAVYAQFMLVQGIVAGLRGVDPAQVDAARGLGLSDREVLLRVELPLALPIAIGGLRVAAIACISIATLAAYVGAPSLGTLIFEGLALHNAQMLIAGSVATAALAIAVDVGLRRAFQ